MVEKPIAKTSLADKELQKAEKQFEAFEENVSQLTMDRMNAAPKQEVEPQTKLSQKEIENMKEIYLKPFRTIGSREKFNERFRDDYNFAKEYVYFTAENKEVQGETIDFWIKPYPGLPAEEWKVPVNKPVWGPRYVAERINGCTYHRMMMQDNVQTGTDGIGTQYYGHMAVDTTVARLSAAPASRKKSLFMGASNF